MDKATVFCFDGLQSAGMKMRRQALACGMAVLVTVGVPGVTSAQTNNWISSTRGYWDDYGKWSLGITPTNTHSVYITNDLSKTVTVDSYTSGVHPDAMTVSNLFLSAPVGATNTLELSGAGTSTPLTILDSFNISAGGLLRLTNAAIWVQRIRRDYNGYVTIILTNTAFSSDGTIVLGDNGVLTSEPGLYTGRDADTTGTVWLAGGRLLLTSTTPSAIGIDGPSQMIVSNGEVQTASSFIFVGSGNRSQGALTLAGGSYVSSPFGRLVIGMETGAVGVVSVTSGNLIITNSFITLVGGDGAGQLNLFNGTNTLGALQVGGNPGSAGTLTVAGGVQDLQGGLHIGASLRATGTVWMTGGQVVATNFPTCIAPYGYGLVTVSNGNWHGSVMRVGLYAVRELRDSNGVVVQPAQSSHGNLEADGGAVALLSNLVIGGTATISNLVVGNCPSGAVGVVRVDGGSVYVTNAAHNAFIDVRDGQLILDSGFLQVDTLVITNLCGQFMRNGGSLSITTTNLDPNLSAVGDGIPNGWKQQYGLDPFDPNSANSDADGDGFSSLQEFQSGTDPTNSASSLRITSIRSQGSDLLITWSVTTNKTYKVQVAPDSIANAFADLATVIVPAAPAITETNYLDVGAATNNPPRFYKIKLVTP
jgi:hypothetical protein